MLLDSDWFAQNLELWPLNPRRSAQTNFSFPLTSNFRTRMQCAGVCVCLSVCVCMLAHMCASVCMCVCVCVHAYVREFVHSYWRL